MTEADIEIILQGAKEKHPEGRRRVISRNGPEFIAKRKLPGVDSRSLWSIAWG